MKDTDFRKKKSRKKKEILRKGEIIDWDRLILIPCYDAIIGFFCNGQKTEVESMQKCTNSKVLAITTFRI